MCSNAEMLDLDVETQVGQISESVSSGVGVPLSVNLSELSLVFKLLTGLLTVVTVQS